jgi:hypothetical protein
MSKKESLNPDIREIEIGIRKKRKLVIYPLSVRDQFTLSDLVASVLSDLSSFSEENEVDTQISFIKEIILAIKNNIVQVLTFVIPEEEDPEDLLSELSNNQVFNLAKLIYEVNYEGVVKNAQDLIIQTRKNTSALMGSSPKLSAEQDTESLTSTENLSKKED